jgi:hypothetical protein
LSWHYFSHSKIVSQSFSWYSSWLNLTSQKINSSCSLILGDPQRRASFYNQAKQQYIIDRHIASFEAIINYYETGKLIAPTIYEPNIFFEELKYFQFDDEIIQCFYQTEIKDESTNQYRTVPWNKILRSIWISLEYDDYSFITQIVKTSKNTKEFSLDFLFRFA